MRRMDGRRALSRRECLAHLERGTVARLALTARALPDIVVVRYLVEGDRIVFGAEWIDDLVSLVAGRVVALEVDLSEPGCAVPCWSVCAVGVASAAGQLPAVEWPGLASMHPELITGWAGVRPDRPTANPDADFASAEEER